MMTPGDHYEKAQELIAKAEESPVQIIHSKLIAMAHVHALLSLTNHRPRSEPVRVVDLPA